MSTQLLHRIRAIVEDGTMSRSGLARAAGLHANSLRDLESEGWNPTAETLRKLENWLAHGSRSEEHTSELQSLMRISYAVFCLKKKLTLTNDTLTMSLYLL